MSNERNDFSDFNEEENTTPIQQIIWKYLRYWPWFVGSAFITLLLAVVYLRYADNIYRTEAKVKIISDSNNANFSFDMYRMFSKSTVNIENETALFKSYRLSEQIVKDLKLNIQYFTSGKVKTRNVYDPPFIVSYGVANDSIQSTFQYKITITSKGFVLSNEQTGKSYKTNGYWMNAPVADFPITIQPSAKHNIQESVNNSFVVVLQPIKSTAMQLSNSFVVAQEGKDSDIVDLSISGKDGNHSEIVLNALIHAFENDGIKDKQEVYRRTINFVDGRFIYLLKELDSIEQSKKEYKTKNGLSFIQGDAEASIANKSLKENAVYDVQLQLSLAKMLNEVLEKQTDYDLLPANIGIQNATINTYVDSYNNTVLQYQKMQTTAGSKNPALQVVNNALSNLKKNINNSTNGYIQQLQTTIKKTEASERDAQGNFSSLPEKEKILRSIERQQNLKESLYLLLLQKKEEASISLAITVPNTKVIDYAITQLGPISPKRQQIYLASFLIGLLIPFGILFVIFFLDDKIHIVGDVEKIAKGIPVLAEIPNVMETSQGEQQKQEAFRTLVNNTNFITSFEEHNDGKVIFITSAKKGEGKTFVSYNLSRAYANLEKKTILIGTDFRNPQLHKHINTNRKDNKGLSNYLHNKSNNWREIITNTNEEGYSFDILLAGDIPPNPTLLLSNNRFANLLAELKKEYEIIILDTAPTLLVSDSLIISKYADTTLFVVRSGVTEKNLVQYAVKLNEEKKINNTGFVLNGVDYTNGYGYGYGYGYSYSYGYNYGYGYGYGLDEVKRKWYKQGFFAKFLKIIRK